jgi:two-component system response regulator
MKENAPPILMVDDDAEDRMLLKDAFDELRHSGLIHFEENGERAVDYLSRCIALDCVPCLIILDLNMPRLNGRQTLQWIKKQTALKHATVIIYSTSLNPIEKNECLALGAYSYVVKPISYKESLVIANEFYSLSVAVAKKLASH